MRASVGPVRRRGSWVAGLMILFSGLLMACGTTATPTLPLPEATTAPTASDGAAQPTPMSGTTSIPAPTATLEPTPAPPTPAVSGKDRVILVTPEEPTSIGAWHTGCSPGIQFLACDQDPFTWIDGETLEVVPLSGVSTWEQVDSSRWRFTLREGVKFQNGEPWNAAAAKMGLDMTGNNDNGLIGYGFHGPISGEVVNEHTVDVVCGEPCPTFPRNAIYIRFQAPAWYQSASEEEQARTTIGFGPYQVVEWRPGVDVTLEAYEGYLPNEAFESQAPVIQNITQLWRAEALVRAAMVDTGEADWAYDIGSENEESVPVTKAAGTTETYYLSLDTIWHPELMKKEVRQALNHAIDCPAIMDALYQGRIQCHGNISPPGTLGLTPENSEPYEYDPDLARQLLEEAGYDPENEIRIYTREATAYLNVEFLEAVVGYWREVGINAQLEVTEPSRHQEIRRSGCGKFGEEALTCHEQDPPAPFAASSHAYDSTLTNAPMDFQRPSLVRLSCFHVNTRVCDRELEEKINTMVATPEGPERLRLMEELANIVHDEYYFVPFFPIEVVYGLAEGLVWEPRYDPRLRVNTMRWAN